MLIELLGLTPEEIARDETWDPKKGKRTRDFGDKVGDKVMSILTGTDYATEVQKHTKTNHVDFLTDNYGDRITKTKGLEGYDNIGDLSKLSEKKLEQELKNREATRRARSTRKATTGETDADLDLTETDPGTIVSGGTKYEKDEVKKKERKAEDLQMLLLSQQGQRNDNQFAIQMAQQDYQNRALEMKDARLERRDRQAAIQQMMAGLATMGASIAI
jgi:hypothetical protein